MPISTSNTRNPTTFAAPLNLAPIKTGNSRSPAAPNHSRDDNLVRRTNTANAATPSVHSPLDGAFRSGSESSITTRARAESSTAAPPAEVVTTETQSEEKTEGFQRAARINKSPALFAAILGGTTASVLGLSFLALPFAPAMLLSLALFNPFLPTGQLVVLAADKIHEAVTD